MRPAVDRVHYPAAITRVLRFVVVVGGLFFPVNFINMCARSYARQRDALINNAAHQLKESELNSLQFQLVSASLVNYLPGIAFEEHHSIFNKINLHRRLSVLEQSNKDALDLVDNNDEYRELLRLIRHQPAVICTFHTGSYRLLNLMLIKEAIPFSIVVGKEVLETDGAVFRKIFDDPVLNSGKCEFNLINAEDPGSGLKMLKELKSGRSLVLYIDGNSGAGSATSANENSCVVDFLAQQLFARKGIAWLAHVARVPIVVAICIRKTWERIFLRVFDPIVPGHQDRSLFAESATQHIYDLVSPLISENPEQWEGWLYLHKNAKIIHNHPQYRTGKKTENVGEKAIFNSTLFGKFKIDGTAFLFGKQGYEFYEIDDRLYRLLKSCTDQPAAKEIFGDALFDELWKKDVLTHSPV